MLKIGIIGCGGIANGKHMPSLKKVKNCEMIAFCDIVEERAIDAANLAFVLDGYFYGTQGLLASTKANYEVFNAGESYQEEDGGLGFDYKWDLGWMHDTLKYFECHPFDRVFMSDKITFSIFYAYNERYILPFSHDEVVHGKDIK